MAMHCNRQLIILLLIMHLIILKLKIDLLPLQKYIELNCGNSL